MIAKQTYKENLLSLIWAIAMVPNMPAEPFWSWMTHNCKYLTKILPGWQRGWCFSSAGAWNGSLCYHCSCRVLLGVQGRLGKWKCKTITDGTVTAAKEKQEQSKCMPGNNPPPPQTDKVSHLRSEAMSSFGRKGRKVQLHPVSPILLSSHPLVLVLL